MGPHGGGDTGNTKAQRSEHSDSTIALNREDRSSSYCAYRLTNTRHIPALCTYAHRVHLIGVHYTFTHASA